MPQPRRARPPAQRTARQDATRPQRLPDSGSAAVATAALAGAFGVTPVAAIAAAAAAARAGTAELAKAQARTAVATIHLGFGAQSVARRRVIPYSVAAAVRSVRPWATPEQVAAAIRAEQARELDFRRRQLVRLRRDLPAAVGDPARLGSLVDRERRYSVMRSQALADRAAGAADALNVRELEPEGPVWLLGPRNHHTPDCEVLHGHAIPWEVLDAEQLIPPVHAGCGCRLRPRSEAWRMGITPEMLPVLSLEDARALVARARAVAHEPPHGVLLGSAALAR